MIPIRSLFSNPIRSVLIAALVSASGLAGLHAADSLATNGNFETDNNSDQWPDDWGKPKEGGSWGEEGGNHFLRLEADVPDRMTMLYREIPIPAGTQALELKFRARVTGLKTGTSPWFDARIMMELMDASRGAVKPAPSAPSFRKDTGDWVEKTVQFLVPEGAKTLKFMPCLFKVGTGTFELDDISITPVDPAGVLAEKEAKEQAAKEKQQKDAANKQAKAAQTLESAGSLIPDGAFEGSAASKKNVAEEEGNHFLRLQSTEPGKLYMEYREVPIPAGVPALELTWKQRVSGLKKGEKPWFDARIMMEWKDAAGKKLSAKPSPPYTQKDTAGWVEKSTSFLVPEGATTLVFMPSLFQVEAGTYDLDDIVLKPTDPAPILAKKADYDRQVAARHVPDEEPVLSKWPKMLKVQGNRLVDSDGKEVWLQGVNAGGLETLPQDEQAVKSLVVAIDDWKANCVRVPIKEEFWWGKSPYQNDGGEAFRQKIDKMVTLAANRGAYIVIDLHRYRAPKAEYAEFWKEFAAKYKDHPAVLFDLMNEPHETSWEVWRNGGWVGNKGAADESAFLADEEKKKNEGFQSVGMQGLVDAVRSTGAKNLVIAGGLHWCNDLSGIVNGYALEDKGGNGIMYSWHTYNWHKGWDKVLPVAEKYPIFLGEVGADEKKMDFIPAEIQESPYTWVPDMLGFIQKHKINWTAWCLHPKATPVLITNWDYEPSPFWGVFAKRALAGEQFDMKNMR